MNIVLKYIAIWFVFVCFKTSVIAQDTSTVFEYNDFIEVVKNHHPIAYLAALKTSQGNAYVQKAKGGFDPKLNGEAYQKYYDGTQYYSYINGGLKIPTWFGLTAQAGYNLNRGEYLNPEGVTPDAGLWYAGLSINLGNGLIIDQRRAELNQAEIYRNSTALEQRLILNQLIYDGANAYWDWFKAFNKKEIYANAVQVAKERLEGVKLSCLLGDRPYIDTVEATIQFQNRKIKLEQAKLELLNKKAQLEVFLWQDGNVPLEIDSTLRPNTFVEIGPTLPYFIEPLNFDSLVNYHPEFIQMQNGIAISKIDYRLKRENLKPTVELKYNAISSPTNQNIIGSYSINDYTWGAQFSYPIFTRKERADVTLVELKIQEQEFKMADKNAFLKYKIESAYNIWYSTAVQYELYNESVKNFILLFNAESSLFYIGESSLFLINSREQAMINAKVELIDVLFQNYSANAFYNYQVVSF